VLGIEAVLSDGTVMTSLNKMQKNNAGYDLKQLFIGSEGTLGVITRAVLRLFPRPASICTAFCALPGYEAVLALLSRARARLITRHFSKSNRSRFLAAIAGTRTKNGQDLT